MEKTNSQLPDGVFAATLTPLTKDLSIDHYSLILHMKGLLANGCDGIGFMGTTGEATSFSVSERINALEAVLGAGIAPRKLLVGTGCAAFSDAVALTFHAVRCGVGGVLVLPPFYYKGVSDEGLFRYYAEIIERTSDPGIRIYLYHFPKMTALPLSEQLIGRLLKAFPGIVAGIKDSGGDWNNMKLLTERFPGFRVYAGTERFLLDILQTGGPGCISATTNITSPMAARVYASRDAPDARHLQEQLTTVRSVIEKRTMIPGLKHLMAAATGRRDWLNMRPPNVPLDAAEATNLENELNALGFDLVHCRTFFQ